MDTQPDRKTRIDNRFRFKKPPKRTCFDLQSSHKLNNTATEHLQTSKFLLDETATV